MQIPQFSRPAILFLMLSLFGSSIQMNAQAKLDTTAYIPISILPGIEHNLELIYKLHNTRLITNERDMPVNSGIDSMVIQVLIHKTDTGSYVFNLIHFERLDHISNTPYIASRDFLKNDTIKVLIGSNLQFIGLLEHKKWSDTLLNRAKADLNAKRISLLQYNDLKKTFANPLAVQETVLDFWLEYFEIYGSNPILWTEYNLDIHIPNPYTGKSEYFKTTETFITLTANPNHYIRRYSYTTSKEHYAQLASQYKSYLLSTGSDPKMVDMMPDPKIELHKTLYQTFNHKSNQVDLFRREFYVSVNGAREFMENYLKLQYVRKY